MTSPSSAPSPAVETPAVSVEEPDEKKGSALPMAVRELSLPSFIEINGTRFYKFIADRSKVISYGVQGAHGMLAGLFHFTFNPDILKDTIIFHATVHSNGATITFSYNRLNPDAGIIKQKEEGTMSSLMKNTLIREAKVFIKALHTAGAF